MNKRCTYQTYDNLAHEYAFTAIPTLNPMTINNITMLRGPEEEKTYTVLTKLPVNTKKKKHVWLKNKHA